jgi:diamine N-acetyltransferase
MAEVHLRRITAENEKECLELSVDAAQAKFIATNAQSLAQAEANPALVPLGVYDRAARGYLQPRVPMIGCVMYEIDCGVG